MTCQRLSACLRRVDAVEKNPVEENPAAGAEAARQRIQVFLRDELHSPQLPDALALADDVRRHYGGAVLAILLYGSCLRDRTSDGLFDFYVVVDGYAAAGLSMLGALAARLLPPAVFHHKLPSGRSVLRAKVAVIALADMRRRMEAQRIDTTLWARFCQPAALLYVRDRGVIDRLTVILGEAIVTAALWAARLGPDVGSVRDYWRGLLRATYAAELRVEQPHRVDAVVAAAPQRYERLLADAWCVLGLSAPSAGPILNPLGAEVRRRHVESWRRRRWLTKSLNALRLAKAAFTFSGGADYVLWKVERHSGPLALSGFQRKHPVLAAPSILWLLIRYRMVR